MTRDEMIDVIESVISDMGFSPEKDDGELAMRLLAERGLMIVPAGHVVIDPEATLDEDARSKAIFGAGFGPMRVMVMTREDLARGIRAYIRHLAEKQKEAQ